MDTTALRSLLLVTMAIFLVLLARRPLRQGFASGRHSRYGCCHHSWQRSMPTALWAASPMIRSTARPRADLIAAASSVARQWRVNPKMEDGKPIEGYTRVPVKFSLSPLPGEIDKDQVEKLSSKY